MLKFLSSEYRLYACGKNFSHALILNKNHHFAKGSVDIEKINCCQKSSLEAIIPHMKTDPLW
jgi:hypothetical protein